MALNAYLKCKGQKQGQLNGSVTQKGRKNSIMVIAWNHEIVSPRDAASGLPTGKRMHKPLVITKELDKSTPLFYNALVNNENITEWEMQCWQHSATGTEKQHYTIKLTNASIASIHAVMENNRHLEFKELAEYEEIAFTYQKIEWIWVDGGITAMDDWESPIS